MVTIEPLAYTVTEACAAARISRTSLYKAIAEGKLIARKRGRRTVILASDLRSFSETLPIIQPRNRTQQAGETPEGSANSARKNAKRSSRLNSS